MLAAILETTGFYSGMVFLCRYQELPVLLPGYLLLLHMCPIFPLPASHGKLPIFHEEHAQTSPSLRSLAELSGPTAQCRHPDLAVTGMAVSLAG